MTIPYNNLLDTNDKSFVWGNGLISASGQDEFYYLQDHLGSPIRLLSEDRDDVLGFDEFGMSTTNSKQSFSNPFGFTGYQIDDTSGLQYAQARFYNPMLGRFNAEDPIRDQLNWYGYCHGNPIIFVDPSGLADENGGYGFERPSSRPDFIGPQQSTGGLDWNHAINNATPNGSASSITPLPQIPLPNITPDDLRAGSNAVGFGLGLLDMLGNNITQERMTVRETGNIQRPHDVRIDTHKPLDGIGKAAGVAGMALTVLNVHNDVRAILNDETLSEDERVIELVVLATSIGCNILAGFIGGKIASITTKVAGPGVGLAAGGATVFYLGEVSSWYIEWLRDALYRDLYLFMQLDISDY